MRIPSIPYLQAARLVHRQALICIFGPAARRARWPALVVCAALIAGGCGSADSEEATPSAYRNVGPDVAYVGKEACRSCHADKFETFTRSQMGRSLKPARLEHSKAKWDDVEPVFDADRDLYYQAFHRGDDLFIMEYRLADGDTVHKRTEQITYVVGSGQHTNSHMMDVNGYLYQMPMTWYAQDGRWDLPPKYDDGNNYRFNRPITQACMGCHNGISEFVPGSENKFGHVPEGIDCERCHGPGELHVEEKMAGEIVDVTKEIDYSIVHPGKLPVERQFDVCQRCHMQGATVFKDGKDPFDFRPGMRLAEVMNVYWPRFSDSTSQFIMASHPDRLTMSDCFIESRDRDGQTEPMTCTTCHDPHLPIEALGTDHYRTVCQTCHATGEAADLPAGTASLVTETAAGASSADVAPSECTASESARLRVQDDCVSCHMPRSGSTDIPHVSITDHFIRVPQKVSEEQLDEQREFVGLASLIDGNPSSRDRAMGYVAYYEEFYSEPHFLDSADVYLKMAREEESLKTIAPALIHLRFLQEDFDAIVRLHREIDLSALDDAWTFYRMGEAHLSVGDTEGAVALLERAVELSPAHLRFIDRLGSAYTTARRFDRAVETFDRVLAAHPKYDQAYNNRGFARAMLGDAAGAEADLLRAIELDPDAYFAVANLASLYLNTGREEEARPYARRLLDSDPSNETYRRLWNMLN